MRADLAGSDNINIMFFLKFRYVFVINLVVLLCIGCATAPTRSIQVVYDSNVVAQTCWPDSILESRFKEYWSNRFSGQVEDNYKIENPYFQEVVSLGKYRNFFQSAQRNKLIRMEIIEIEKMSGYLIKIECNAILARDGGSSQVEVSMADRWVSVGGIWYHVIKDPLFSL
jgi:hypothetical protein